MPRMDCQGWFGSLDRYGVSARRLHGAAVVGTPFFMEIKLVMCPGLWRRVGCSGLSGMDGGIGKVACWLSDGATGWFEANGRHAFLKCRYEYLCWFGHFGGLVPFAWYASSYLAWLAFLVLPVWLAEDGLVSAGLVRMVHCERFSAV
ncbi:hypothetical protein Nepgr_002694 [Nepenthes gracilis]|uniref:Uncharacterized protein n=1 Tax=Nepenthes gracilis TaxID=150966 RepID=A0AAD3P463_NEPGR|nr:hypothetical protein Nepgr_002694 [Nepenthes gracilis]